MLIVETCATYSIELFSQMDKKKGTLSLHSLALEFGRRYRRCCRRSDLLVLCPDKWLSSNIITEWSRRWCDRCFSARKPAGGRDRQCHKFIVRNARRRGRRSWSCW